MVNSHTSHPSPLNARSVSIQFQNALCMDKQVIFMATSYSKKKKKPAKLNLYFLIKSLLMAMFTKKLKKQQQQPSISHYIFITKKQKFSKVLFPQERQTSLSPGSCKQTNKRYFRESTNKGSE